MVVCQTNIRLPADLPKLNNRSADCVERSISLALVASLQYRCSFYILCTIIVMLDRMSKFGPSTFGNVEVQS